MSGPGAGQSARHETGPWRTLVRGLQLSPELRDGLRLTLALALVATAGRIVVPIAIQQVIDSGVLRPEGPRPDLVLAAVGSAIAVIVLTSLAGYGMISRLARTTETALSALRVRAFRHIHDLSMLHHADEHRGALVSRVTSDVDQISRFMHWGGLILIISIGQLTLATLAMAVYSWRLTLIVLLVFAPLGVILRWFQQRLSGAYDLVRERVAVMLSAISESVVGAPVIRAYGIEGRTNARISSAVDDEFQASFRAARLAGFMFSSGEVFAATAMAGAIAAGVVLGLEGMLAPPGEPWVGRLVAFVFLVNLFVGPVQIATEVLDQAQTAISGWRRVLAVLDTPPDVADPGSDGEDIPPGPISVRFDNVGFRYPAAELASASDSADERGLGPPVLHSVDLEIPAQRRVAIVGETGSGKTTFAKLLTRLMDPTSGRILVNGLPLDEARFSSLRRRVVMVPQDGFLFDTSVAANVRHGHAGVDDDDVLLAFTELGLADWAESLPDGIHSRVGERGESLSVGERQLVALARAYVANPDLLLLDEATSAVDPATEVRVQRALEGLTRGRTAIAIAHRLSTAEAADEVLVFDQGRIVQRGPHASLVEVPGAYARLYESWTAATRGGRRA